MLLLLACLGVLALAKLLFCVRTQAAQDSHWQLTWNQTSGFRVQFLKFPSELVKPEA